MSEDIVPTNGPQNEERAPAAIVQRVTPMLANSEPVVEVSFGETLAHPDEEKTDYRCSHLRLLRYGPCLLL